MKRLTDISQKHNEAAVDNRVLKADVETLRAKVGYFQCLEKAGSTKFFLFVLEKSEVNIVEKDTLWCGQFYQLIRS